jgi:hypothetical protein
MKREMKKLDKEFSNFVDDLAGLLWHHRSVHNARWKDIAAEGNLHVSTIMKLAARKTKNPMLNTVWQVLRALDNSSIIRHSMLEKYRGISNKSKPKPRLTHV